MTRRIRISIILAMALGLLIILLVWRTPREGEFGPSSSPVSVATSPLPLGSSPLSLPTRAPFYSPLPIPPTAPPPVTTATLEAIRATRPTATPPSAGGSRLPYVSPATWRVWALRFLIAAGVFAYIGLRLRKNQKT
jgi:hypothetical protein